MKAHPLVKRLFYVFCVSLIVSIILLVIWMTVSRREYTHLVKNQPSLNDNNGVYHRLVFELNHTTTNTSHHSNNNNSQLITSPVTDHLPEAVAVSTPPSSTVSVWFPPRVIHHYGSVNEWSSSLMESPSVWKDQFCKEFPGTTFDESSTVCPDDCIVRYGSHFNKHISKCMVNNLANTPKVFKDLFAIRILSFGGVNQHVPSTTMATLPTELPAQVKITHEQPTSTTPEQLVTTYHHSTPQTVSVPDNSHDRTWTNEFCQDFFSNRFTIEMHPCEGHAHRVVCHSSPYDNKMGSCTLTNVAMDTNKFYKTMFDDKDGVRESKSLWFNDPSNFCSNPQFHFMEKKMMGEDFVKRITQTVIQTNPQGKCTRWINGTTFMFMGFDDHIYFKYLSWFSLYNGIINYKEDSGTSPSLIIRIPELKGVFTHDDYEQRLFSETKLMSLKNFTNMYTKGGVVCFDKLIITPWAYSTNAFRCKMTDSARWLRKKCFDCNGKGLNETRFMYFRRKALSACSIRETRSLKKKSITNIVVQVRKPYIRRLGDNLDQFSRVLQNADELIQGLHDGFPGVSVTKMIAEEMSLCDQMHLIHNTDVLIGVHGAGLVHLWWLQDHALLFEIVPFRQRNNPSFKMLATLTGRRYHGYERLRGTEKKIIVYVTDIIQELKKNF